MNLNWKTEMIYEIDLLKQQDLDYFLSAYNKSAFTDGSLSNPSNKKKNLMMNDNLTLSNLNRYGSFLMSNHQELHAIFVTKKISPLYYLWYTEGMKYDYHIDDNPIGGVNAHYSMTCFLSNPSEYEGGELVIKIGSKEIEYKLEAGKAVLYPTGLKHKVNPVISGDRKVFVCWIESAIKNSFVRNYLIEYGNYINNINVVDNTISNASEVIEELEQFRINLMREYGDL